MTRRMIVILAVVILMAAVAQAQQARIDVQSKQDGVVLEIAGTPEGGSAANASWPKTDEEKARYLTYRLDAPIGEWKEMKIAFKSNQDTEVSVSLQGLWKKDDQGNMVDVFNLFDDVTVEGSADAKNLDFENATKSDAGAPKFDGWWVSEKAPAELVTEAGKAHGGSSCIKVSNRTPVGTRFNVKAGETVTVTAWVRGVE